MVVVGGGGAGGRGGGWGGVPHVGDDLLCDDGHQDGQHPETQQDDRRPLLVSPLFGLRQNGGPGFQVPRGGQPLEGLRGGGAEVGPRGEGAVDVGRRAVAAFPDGADSNLVLHAWLQSLQSEVGVGSAVHLPQEHVRQSTGMRQMWAAWLSPGLQ